MNKLLLITSLLLSIIGYSQDTLSGYTRYDDRSFYVIASETDTFSVRNYPSGNREALIAKGSMKGKRLQTVYYDNGNVMYTRELKNNQPNGKSIYFNQKGRKIAEFNVKNDTVIDTLFLSSKHKMIFGKMTYTSVVHGGMPREDGRSNISRSSGNSMYRNMYTVKLDSTKQLQEVYQSFTTDQFGNFFLCVENGDYGFFTERYDIKHVDGKMGTSRGSMGKGVQESWTPTGPITIEKKCYNYVHLHYDSVGYAP